MVLGPDHIRKNLATGVRWGVFSALVVWAIVTWDKPERVSTLGQKRSLASH
jgi:hypothetical protein